MNRPMLGLWPYVWRRCLAVGIVILISLRLALSPGSNPVLVFGLVLLASCSLMRNSGWLWRVACKVRRFRTARHDRVILHYAPELANDSDMTSLLVNCQAEISRLEERFGFRLRGRVVVFLFADYREIAKAFGAGYGGTALSLANAILIAENNWAQEAMRHELTHLFASRWNQLAPPLFNEGLAVWLQQTDCGQPIDKVARAFLRNRHVKLPLLLKSKFFFAEPHRHACYVLAGSFTGFLIRRYGWSQYRKLFRICNGKRYRAKFAKCLGVSLEKAEWQWRNEITVMEILNRRLGRDICL